MSKNQIRVSVDSELWSLLKYEGETDTQVQNRIMAVIVRLRDIDPDPMCALGILIARGETRSLPAMEPHPFEPQSFESPPDQLSQSPGLSDEDF